MEQPGIFETRTNLSELQSAVNNIRAEVSKVIIGQTEMIDLLIISILAGGHVLIEGVPGVAKTLTAKLISKTMSAQFSRIQFTPDLMPSDVLGTSIYNVKTGEFEYKKGPIFSNLVLADEINRAPAKTQAALFEVMEEQQVTNDGKSYAMSQPFMIIATQNPIEHEGTYRLPEAQLDRFLFKIKVDYPGRDLELEMLEGIQNRKGNNDANTISSILSPQQIIDLREKVKQIHVEKNLLKFITEIIHQTRSNKSLYLGASPRAAIAILNAAKANAAINNRDFVIPEDILFVVYPVLRHRVMLSAEKEMEGISTDDVIKQIIQTIEVPR